MFLGVGTDDADAIEIFLDAAGNIAELGLDEFEALVDFLAEVNNGEADEGGGDEGDEGELPVDGSHDGDGEQGGEESFGPVHDAGAEHHADLVEIVGGAGHEIAGAHGLVEGGTEAEEVGEDIVADVEFHVPGNADEDEAHEVLENAAGEAEQDDEDGEDPEAGEVLVGEEGVEAVADEQGVDAGKDDFAEQATEAEREAAAVTAEVGPESSESRSHLEVEPVADGFEPLGKEGAAMAAVLPPGVEGEGVASGSDDDSLKGGIGLAEGGAGAAGMEVRGNEDVAFEAGLAEEVTEGDGFVAGGVNVEVEGPELGSGTATGDEPIEGGVGFVLAIKNLIAAQPELGGIALAEEIAAGRSALAAGIPAEDEDDVGGHGGLGVYEIGGGGGGQRCASEPEYESEQAD